MVLLDKLPKYLLYGPGFCQCCFYKNVKCIWSLERDKESHHCPEKLCGAIDRTCYDTMHAAFCAVVISTTDGYRFCGTRLGVTSPSGCSLHSWGSNDENRIYQRVKKDQDFEYPRYFPQLEPGWKMSVVISNRPAIITVDVLDNELYYFLQNDSKKPNKAIKREPLLKIPQRELDMVGYKIPKIATEEEASMTPAPIQKPAALQAIFEEEQTNDSVYNNPQSYISFNEVRAQTMKTEGRLVREAREARKVQAAQETKRKANTAQTNKEKTKETPMERLKRIKAEKAAAASSRG